MELVYTNWSTQSHVCMWKFLIIGECCTVTMTFCTTPALFNFLSQEQYQMVFEAVLAYLGSFDTYANFQNI